MGQIGHLRARKDKNGNNRYQMIVEVWRNGKKYYKSKTFSSEKEATRWANKIRYEIDQGIVTKETLKNRKLSCAIEKYIAEVLPHKPKNARNVEQHLKWWGSQLGHLQLSDVSAMEVGECRDRLLKGTTCQNKKRAPATVVRYISSLSSVFETAIKEWHWVEKNPVKMIRKPTVSNARTAFLSEEECKRLLVCCKESRNPYLYPVVVLALSTGMRRGELLGLKWGDVDFERQLIILKHTKNGSTRYVPMVGIALQALKTIFENETILDRSYHIFPGLNLKRYLAISTE
jgi:integrase